VSTGYPAGYTVKRVFVIICGRCNEDITRPVTGTDVTSRDEALDTIAEHENTFHAPEEPDSAADAAARSWAGPGFSGTGGRALMDTSDKRGDETWPQWAARRHDEAHGPSCNCLASPGRRAGKIPLPPALRTLDTVPEGRRVTRAVPEPDEDS
jgi:hypothetical protein